MFGGFNLTAECFIHKGIIDLIIFMTAMNSLSTENRSENWFSSNRYFPRNMVLSNFISLISVHHSSPENVQWGSSFVALKEKKLVSAIYSIMIILGICFYLERRKNFVSFVLVMTQRPIPFFSCGKTSVMHVVMSMADISKEHAGWECQSPM